MLKRLIIGIVLIGAMVLIANSPRARALQTEFQANLACCDLSFARAATLTAREAFGSFTSYSEIGQDKWVLWKMFPDTTNGYFLDVGSGHGTIGSNTKSLEERGWTGICVDPFPTHMEGRTCLMVREVVSNSSGQVIRFHTHEGLGGIEDTLGRWKEEASKSPVVDMTTVTLGQVLERAKAPAYIHFMSVDIEGAELLALQGIPFDKYRFGAMAIEHNDEEPKRTNILTYLASKGYRRVRSYKQDDFYAP